MNIYVHAFSLCSFGNKAVEIQHEQYQTKVPIVFYGSILKM